jgi:hypothetical protein
MIKHIDDTALCTKLDTVSVSFDAENGGLTGSVTLDKYFITSGSDPYVPPRARSELARTTSRNLRRRPGGARQS